MKMYSFQAYMQYSWNLPVLSHKGRAQQISKVWYHHVRMLQKDFSCGTNTKNPNLQIRTVWRKVEYRGSVSEGLGGNQTGRSQVRARNQSEEAGNYGKNLNFEEW